MSLFLKIIPVFGLLFLVGAANAQTEERDRGIELYREGKYTEAVTILESFANADPKDRQAWLFLGAAHVQLGNDKLARRSFVKADNLRAKDPSGYDALVKIAAAPRPSYPRGVASSQGAAKVRLAIELLSSGKVGFIRSLDHGGQPEFERESIAAARLIQFTPAVQRGKPVTTIQIKEYNFWVQ